MNAYAERLRDHPVFCRLPRRLLQSLTAEAGPVELRKGGILVKSGDPCEALYVVLSGRCEAVVTLASGSRNIVDIIGPGSLIGERAILSHDTYSATVRVVTDCVAIRLAAASVREAMARHPAFERDLLRRVYGEFRVQHDGPAAAKLGRVAVMCSRSRRVRGVDLACNVAAALRAETGRSVLLVQIACGGVGISLADWQRLPPCSLEELRAVTEVHKARSGVWILRLCAADNASEVPFVAPVLSHLARYARYVLIYLDASVPAPLGAAMLQQSDLPFVLSGQNHQDLAAVQAMARLLSAAPGDERVQALPLVCLDPGERAWPQSDLETRLGLPLHATLQGLPANVGDPQDFYLRQPRDRFSVSVRHVAREIGRCRLGVAFSSGGAKSLAHIGVIQVLEENGIEVDVVAGTSMGGLVGALFAYGLDGKAIAAIAMRNERRWGRLGLVDPVFPIRRGFIGGVAVPRIVRGAIGDACFADLLRPLRVVATNLETLERVVFASGDVAPAVHASMAMPGIVVPVSLDGNTLVDGGVAEPLPVNVLAEMGVERIIAVNTIANPDEMRRCALAGGGRSRRITATGRVGEALDRYVNYFARGNILDVWAKSMHGAETRVAEAACKLADVVVRPVSCDGRWHDFDHASRYIALGRQATEAKLEDIRRLVR